MATAFASKARAKVMEPDILPGEFLHWSTKDDWGRAELLSRALHFISSTRICLGRQECVQQKPWGFECGFYPREQQNQVCQELEKPTLQRIE